jgi:hypothetical protein
MQKISLCTVSMNRLSHVRETLPANVHENIHFPNIEFVLLDYNSSDGLEAWVRSNMMGHIESGILKYYRTSEPKYFDMSHSKNMVCRISSGDIICMIDGDNYAGLNYAAWVYSVFSKYGNNSVLSAFGEHGLEHPDMGGKLAFHRDRFAAVRGFDEAFLGYGVEDRDLVDRLEKAGGTPVLVEDKAFSRYIEHAEIDRVKNYHTINNLEGLYLLPTDLRKILTALYLFNDNTCCEVTYKFASKDSEECTFTIGGWYVERNGYKKGTFKRTREGIILSIDKPDLFRYESGNLLTSFRNGARLIWRKMDKSDKMYVYLLKSYGECYNRIKYIQNKVTNDVVNPDGWGMGTAFLNFDYINPVQCGFNGKTSKVGVNVPENG